MGIIDVMLSPIVPQLDTAYISRLSITNQSNELSQHVWSFTVGHYEAGSSTANCPCSINPGRAPPSFVGADYYCESGAHMSVPNQWHTCNQLWDGKGCYSGSKCCYPSRAPWVLNGLPAKATSDIEIRWCQPNTITNDKTGIKLLELYVY